MAIFLLSINPLTVSLLIIGLVYLWLRYLKYARWVAALNKLPGPPPGWPVIGHLPLILKPNMSPQESFYVTADEINRKYGKDGIWHLALGPDHIIMLTKAKAVEKILTCTTNIKKDNSVYDLLIEWWGQGLISSWGDKWHTRRKMLTPAFHFNILQEFLPIMNDQSDILIKKMHTLDSQPVNVVDLITRITLDVIGETSMGIKLNAQSNTNSEYLESIKVMGDTAVGRTFGGFHYKFGFLFRFTELGKKYRRALIHLVTLTQRVIRERKNYLIQEITKNGSETVFQRKAMPLLDILLKNHLLDAGEKTLTLQDVLEETEQFMFAGHDTTAYAICWTLYLLGHHPEPLSRVQEELDQVFTDDPNRHVTAADLTEMTYLDMCLKEAIRIYSTVPMIARETVADTEIAGYHIPKGSSVYVGLFLMARDEEQFPNWQEFNPDRFSKEAVAERDHFAFTPFSAGLRNCIGQKYAVMEAKTILAKVLRSFSVKSMTPLKEMRAEPSMILRPVSGSIRLVFTGRK